MRILVISDSHLYLPVDYKKLHFLKELITSHDRVILNGDFFDAYMINFKEFIESPWNELFPLLKAKHTVYLYGNHDKRVYSDKETSLFSEVQADRYKIKTKDKVFIFEHGHKIRVTPDAVLKIEGKLLSRIVGIAHIFRQIMTRIFGKLFIKTRFSYRNIIAKKRIRQLYNPTQNEVYIIGHNHWGEIDLKNNFASSGMILYGFAQYLTIDDGVIKLHEQWY